MIRYSVKNAKVLKLKNLCQQLALKAAVVLPPLLVLQVAQAVRGKAAVLANRPIF